MTDFGTIVSPGIRPAEHRNKAAEEAKVRLNALPAECEPWKCRLTMQGLEALAVVVRANRTAGGPCIVHRGDIADALGLTPEGGGRLLDRLVEIGAVERRERIAQAPIFAPVTTPPAALPSHQARKADTKPAAPEPIRKVAGVTDPKLKAGLVGMRNPEEPPKTNLLAGVIGANPRR